MRGKKPLAVFYLIAIGYMYVCMYVCRIARVFSAAEKADYSVIDELMTLLQRPYEEGPYIHSYIRTYIHTYTNTYLWSPGTLQQEQRWYRSTPPWARNMPGVAFMS